MENVVVILLCCRKNNENVSLLINIKLVNYPPQTRPENVNVVLQQNEEDIVDLIPFNGAFEIGNKEYQVSGKEWTLQFHGGSEFEVGKFWIQIEGTKAKKPVRFFFSKTIS